MADHSRAKRELQQLALNQTELQSLLDALKAELLLSPSDCESIFKAPSQDRIGLLTSKLSTKPTGSFTTFCQALRRRGMDEIVQILESSQQETREEHHDRPRAEKQEVPLACAAIGGYMPVKVSGQETVNLELPQKCNSESNCCIFVAELTVSDVNTFILGSNNQATQNVSCGPSTDIPPPEPIPFNAINPVVPEIVGRNDDMEKLVNVILSSPLVVQGIEGPVGIGKTTLALAVCKEYRSRVQKLGNSSCSYCYMVEFPRALKQPEEIYEEIIGQVFGGRFRSRGLGSGQSNFLPQLRDLCKRLGKDCLLFLDSCETCFTSEELRRAFLDSVKAFLCHSDGIRIITTSSQRTTPRLWSLPYKRHELKELEEEAAVCLLERACQPAVPGDLSVLKQIAAYCYYYPSALSMIAAWLEAGCDSARLLVDLQTPPENSTRKLQRLDPPFEVAGVDRNARIIPCLQICFDRLAEQNESAYISLLYLSLLPGPFSDPQFKDIGKTLSPGQGWNEDQLPVVQTVLRKGFFIEMRNTQTEKQWKLQPLVRVLAEAKRVEKPTIDQEAKLWFVNYYSSLLQTMSLRFYSNTVEVINTLDGHIHNIRLLLRCSTDWKATFKEFSCCRTALFQGLVAPKASYILKLRFPESVRFEAYEGLHQLVRHHEMPKINPILGEASVLLEMAIIQGRTAQKLWERRKALDWLETASHLFAGEAADYQYQAVFLSIQGSILAKISTTRDLIHAENLLVKAAILSDKLRRDSSTHEQYCTWTDHLAWTLKEIAFVHGRCPGRQAESLQTLHNALELRQEVFGDRHVTLAVLLWKIGDQQTRVALQSRQKQLRRNLLSEAVSNMESAIAICASHGCNGHHICGLTHLALSHTLKWLGHIDKAFAELKIAEDVFTALKHKSLLQKVKKQRTWLNRRRHQPHKDT